MSQVVRDTGLTAADAWAIADDRSTWRALRPIAGYAQQWVSELQLVRKKYLFLRDFVTVTVKWLAVKTASEMTYTGGALNSTQSNPMLFLLLRVTTTLTSIFEQGRLNVVY